jgi:hypothetical protein
VAEEPGATGLGVCVPTLVAVIVCGAITKLALALVIELAPQLPAPPVDDAVTVKGVVLPELVALVVIVRVDVALPFETVVGLKAATDPVGSDPLNTSGIEVQVPFPLHVAVIKYVDEFGGVAGFGVCVPTVTAVIVCGA